MRGWAGKGGGGVIREVLLALLLAALMAAFINLVVMRGFGVFLVAVEGHSMHPLFESGDVVIVERVMPQDIHVGDIIVYRGCGGHLIIHRVFHVCRLPGGTYCYTTWGDNNPIPDTPLISCSNAYCDNLPCIPYSRVLGKVVEIDGVIYKVPFIGGLSLLR